MSDVGIIGAGITGLSAAHHLTAAGVRPTLYDAAPRTGGVICSFRDGPWLAEGGPNTILETDPVISRLISDLGLAPRRLYSDPAASARYVVRGRRPVSMPGSGPEFFLSRMFSWSAKLRLLREPFIARGTAADESVASFVRRRLGQEFLSYAIDPMVTGIYAGDPEALSIRHAFSRIHALETRYGSLIRGQILGARERKRRGDVSKASARKFSFDDGLQVLPDTLAARLGDAVQLRTQITQLSRLPSGWRVQGLRDGAPFQNEHRVVLFCGTAGSLARLQIHAPDLPALTSLAEIPYPPVSSVVLGFRRSDVGHPSSGFGMLIPHPEGFGILGTIFSSSLFSGRAPENHLTLTTYVGGARRPENAHLPDDALIHLVLEDLRTLLDVRGAPVFRHITRWPHAIPQYNVGYDRFKSLLDDLEAKAPGLFVAGHFRDGVALSDSILTGARNAERISRFLSPASQTSALGPSPTTPSTASA